MNDINTNNLIDVTNDILYVYVAIPKEYICVYHRILAMLTDYGIEMLKDCKASCTDRNSNVIECFNMFNAAIAAYKLNNKKLANTLITYVKAKINQIYRGKDNSTSFVFPVDENGQLKAFITCDDNPHFYIDPTDGNLFSMIFRTDGGIQQQFKLGPEDGQHYEEPIEIKQKPFHYDVDYVMEERIINGTVDPDNYLMNIFIDNIEDEDGNPINLQDCRVYWNLDGNNYISLIDVVIPKRVGYKTLNLIVYYNDRGVIHTVPVLYGIT